MIGSLASAAGSRADAAMALADRARFGRTVGRFTTACTADVALISTPINPTWLLDGSAPVTRAAELARTDDGTTAVYLWDTTRAHYRWEHASDETVTVLAGEVFLRDADAPVGDERRLGAGDVAFFPAGARTTWRVPHHLRKISTLTRPLPGPLATGMRLARELKRLLEVAASRVRGSTGRRMGSFQSKGR